MIISACYIVKNEEKNIGKSIASLQGMYDELIVVDTGSTDNTVEIAAKYGAEIYHFSWQNDFSLARNFALSKATGNWIIFLDADEYYDGPISIRDYLQELDIKNPDKEAVLISLYEDHQRQNPPMQVVRFFRNRPDIRYHGAVHEQIASEKANIACILADKMVFIHTGYHPDKMVEKSKRNLELLLTEVDKNGEREEYYYYIAECYFGLQEYEKAIAYIRRAIASPVRHYREEANYYHILLESMRQCKYSGEEMTKIAAEAIKKFPDMPEFYGEQGIILSSMGRYDDAYKMLLTCMEKYEFTDKEKQDYGYFNAEIMGIIYARLAKLAWLRGEQNVAKLAASYAVCISQGKWGWAEKAEIAHDVGKAASKQVIICIPVYKKDLSPFEKASLKRLNQVLGKYPRTFVAPASLDFDYREYGEGIAVERFPDYFFNNVTSYSALMLKAEFYQRFAQYEYMLIYQTDAFVFEDRLQEFCGMGYDYIGAPVSRFDPVWHAIDARVGNGGLSLRKISAAIRMLKQWDAIMEGSPFSNLFMQWEDLFWGYCGRREDLPFKVPSLRTAAEFAIQANVAHAHKRMEKGWRPFGCHGWYNLDYDFWQSLIERYGFDFSQLPHPGKEAYPRVKAYLTTRNSINMRILWGMYRNGKLHMALNLLDDWLRQYSDGYAGWHHNMEELVCIWRTAAWEKKYSRNWQYLFLRKLAICIQRGLVKDKFYPMLWNLLITLIPYLQKFDYAEMKSLISAIETGWWNIWASSAQYQKPTIKAEKKKIVVLSSIIDEWDMLESFIRHTLTFADIIIVDERFATVRAKEILHKMEAEGLPLIIHSKSLKVQDLDYGINYVLQLNVTDFILPKESSGNIRQCLINLSENRKYALETGFFAPYQPYANRDKFLLSRPLVRLDRMTTRLSVINAQRGEEQSLLVVKELYMARFGQIDIKRLDCGIIPADVELVDISSFVVNQKIQYSR